LAKNLDQLTVNRLLNEMNQHDKTVPLAIEEVIPQIQLVVEQVITSIKQGGKVLYLGSGTSGRLGILDASECPPTFGVSPDLFTGLIAGGEKAIRTSVEDAEDNMENGFNAVQEALTSPNDILIALSASGSTPYVLGGIDAAKEITTASISCTPNSVITDKVNYPIEISVGEEFIKGSSRLKAGTAQKLILNMISTISMIKLGKVYDNFMIDVQATNKKLRERSLKIVQEIAEVNSEVAMEALKISDGNVKTAIIVARYKMKIIDAQHILEEDNNLRKALEKIDSQYWHANL